MTLRPASFESLTDFAVELASHTVEREIALREGLEKAALAIVKIAKEEVGEYQPAVGPYQEWELLAQSTEADKEAKGYRLEAPLERTGELRDSYEAEVDGLDAIAGSKDPIAYYQEIGTAHIPPREVLGPAAIRARKKIERAIGKALVEGLLLQKF